MTITRVTIAALVALLAAPRPAAGQEGDGSNALGLGATRQALEARAARLEQAAQSADAVREAAAIRTRLSRGDFRVGDRILLAVEGEPTLSDTFSVGLGGQLTLPLIGSVPLEGVLRSELHDYLTRRLARSVRDPEVRTRAFVRLSVQGAVTRPGYYGVPADAVLSDVLMAAGGTTQEANIGRLRIERDGKPIWEGKALQQAIAEGRTLDGAGLVAGDQVIVPRRGGTSAGDVLRFVGVLVTIPVTIYTLTRIR
ncbi:MAG TPA: polysaccharide biosynthesis/export family protein [Gemmatimonadales bacterium]|nr:polysaccharide biosynthesis/export family protein [Gemmatimonadales bacterium]